MKHYEYKPVGTCSNLISFDLEGDVVKNVAFKGGCNGNLKAISKLVEGLKVTTIIETLQGIGCGGRSTSCADQFTKAIIAAINGELNEI
ncbi:MAG: TIGR03905 family TSCPD domain-containing protein [Clostridia bacterium]|nr:TIGR03905 family TSCPD domain-containing protein [Clostridia bacterium]